MRATLIHNPSAGDDKRVTIGQIEALMREAGYKVRYQSSKEKGWRKALKKPANVIVVAAGDGTVGKVARRMIGSGVPIAVLPLGTANNISKTLGIADLPVTQLIRSWEAARRRKFDVGVATGPWGERYFVEGIGAGLMTASIPQVQSSKTMPQLTDTGVRVTYAQQIFREHLAECAAIDIKATLDGKDISGRYVLFEVLNMQYIGPNLFLAPEIVPNDGEFQVVLVGDNHREKLQEHIKDWQEGKLWPPEFAARRGSQLQIEWTGFPLHIDDKIWPKSGREPKSPVTIYIKVEAKAVEFLIPKDVDDVQKRIAENTLKGKRVRSKRREGKKPRTPFKRHGPLRNNGRQGVRVP
jgi:diacylglycerol kinase (ATP)